MVCVGRVPQCLIDRGQRHLITFELSRRHLQSFFAGNLEWNRELDTAHRQKDGQDAFVAFGQRQPPKYLAGLFLVVVDFVEFCLLDRFLTFCVLRCNDYFTGRVFSFRVANYGISENTLYRLGCVWVGFNVADAEGLQPGVAVERRATHVFSVQFGRFDRPNHGTDPRSSSKLYAQLHELAVFPRDFSKRQSRLIGEMFFRLGDPVLLVGIRLDQLLKRGLGLGGLLLFQQT